MNSVLNKVALKAKFIKAYPDTRREVARERKKGRGRGIGQREDRGKDIKKSHKERVLEGWI